jgi:Zn-dependent protease with chaperone function
MRSGRSGRRLHAVPLLLVVALTIAASAASAEARRAVRVDRASFVQDGDFFSAIRVAVAIGEILYRFRADFPQPPPIDIVVRAQSAAELAQLDESLSSAGCERVGERAEIIVNPRILRGARALNDAELRSLLGHEIRHAYQFAGGEAPINSPDLWRREVEAFEWELSNGDPAVRPWYRQETVRQLRLYQTFLSDD